MPSEPREPYVAGTVTLSGGPLAKCWTLIQPTIVMNAEHHIALRMLANSLTKHEQITRHKGGELRKQNTHEI